MECFYEKIRIITDLIDKANKLEHIADHPQPPLVDDALSFVRNVLDKTNSTEWYSKIKSIYWGLSSRRGMDNSLTRFISGKEIFVSTLTSIKNEIELYTPEETNLSIDNTANNSLPVIFLSHSSEDIKYGNALEKFITGLGVKKEQFIYTSHSMHKIPFDKDIFDYLRENINRYIYMIILWSDKYLDNPSCLSEMGAAWVLQNDYSHIYTPDFNSANPKYQQCPVNIRKMGIVLNGDDKCKISMLELKDKIIPKFNLTVDEKLTTHLLDTFIKDITT